MIRANPKMLTHRNNIILNYQGLFHINAAIYCFTGSEEKDYSEVWQNTKTIPWHCKFYFFETVDNSNSGVADSYTLIRPSTGTIAAV